MLVFRYEALDSGNGIDPNPEKGEKSSGTVNLRKLGDHPCLTGFALPPRKGNGWRVGRASQSCEVQTECRAW